MELSYLPPLSEFRKLFIGKSVALQSTQHFRKNGFHNRTIIPAANGLVCLTVPIKGGREVKASLKDVVIDNSQRWQTKHWRTITAAYGRSPWFEYYEPSLTHFFHSEYVELMQWNLDILHWLINLLGANISLSLEDNVQVNITNGGVMHPLIRTSNFQNPLFTESLPVYNQVFSDRIGFQPNVSVLDLIFNEGKKGLLLLNT
jgi:hypothetical protein